MLAGTLIAESLAVGTTLDAVPLTVRTINRFAPGNPTADQPASWTLIKFEADDEAADQLAAAFAEVLDEPGWYADFHTDEDNFIVYRHQVFRYRRGDSDGRSEAQAHGRAHGVPEAQLDWAE